MYKPIFPALKSPQTRIKPSFYFSKVFIVGIGNNLNQIARHFNTGGIHSQEMRQRINQSIAAIYEMKYEVIKLAGDFQQVRKL